MAKTIILRANGRKKKKKNKKQKTKQNKKDKGIRSSGNHPSGKRLQHFHLGTAALLQFTFLGERHLNFT